jgi:micrococcal nuclease
MQPLINTPLVRRAVRTLAAIFLVVLVSGGAYTGWEQYHTSEKGEANAPRTTLSTQLFTLVRVVDGDTIHVTDAEGKKESIRLLGIDAPEIHYDALENNECYAWKAKEVLEDFLTDTQRITLTIDPSQATRDAYDRLLGYVKNSSPLFLQYRCEAILILIRSPCPTKRAP